MNQIYTFDNFLPAPEQYRSLALAHEFGTIEFSPTEKFHGIAMAGPAGTAVTKRITDRFPTLTPVHSFFRKSPAGQVEPSYIHSDAMMGDWTAILYLNPNPPFGDGTLFWEHESGCVRRASLAELPQYAADLKRVSVWTEYERVYAVFNRLMMFPSDYFHSRAMVENHGEGDDARLIQVVFGTGRL